MHLRGCHIGTVTARLELIIDEGLQISIVLLVIRVFFWLRPVGICECGKRIEVPSRSPAKLSVSQIR